MECIALNRAKWRNTQSDGKRNSNTRLVVWLQHRRKEFAHARA